MGDGAEAYADSGSEDRRSRRWLRRLAVLGIFGVVIVLAGAWFVGGELMKPVPKQIDELPEGLPAVEVEFDSDTGGRLRGWYSPAAGSAPASRAVALFHGLRGDRRHMVRRMHFLHAAGYATLAIDLQAHGESAGAHMTFGVRESADARAAVRFLRERCPGSRVAAIGVSLGGAACLLGDAPVGADALIVETVYSTVEKAVANRVGRILGAWPAVALGPLLVWQCQPRLGVCPTQLRPISVMPGLRVPVFVIGGEVDEHTTAAETRALYEAAPEPKRLWLVPGAIHRDMHEFVSEEYERRILGFLDESLG